MARGYTEQLRALLLKHGCVRVRSGKGDHEVWRCPKAERPVVVDGKMMSRHTANTVLKQAGIAAKL